MTYVVLARKWRPQTFAEMTGQEHVTRTLSNALGAGKMAHAYLFHGPRGVGKTTAARILARAVNCERGVGPQPCNTCATCTAIIRGTSLDVVEMDGASNRGIDEIRDLREHVGYAPVSSRYKVYIIDEVHMLTEQAFNALLKTLEEPPAHAMFVLATTEVHKVPATILSRCQRFEFRRIPQAAIVERLAYLARQEGIEAEREALALMARRAEGCLRDAESLLDQAAASSEGRITESSVRSLLGLSPLDELLTLLDAVARKDLPATAAHLEHMVAAGMELDRVAMDMVDLLLELVRIRVKATTPDRAGLERVSQDLTPLDLLRCVSVLENALQAARQSARPGPLLESAFFRLALMDRTVEIDEVLRALQRESPLVESRGIATRAEPDPAPAHGARGGVLDKAWRLLLPSTRCFVERAVVSREEDTVVLTFTPDDAYAAEALSREERRGELERALARVSGCPLTVRIVAPPPREDRPPPAKEHPLVKELIRRFNGVVVETRTPREEVTQR